MVFSELLKNRQQSSKGRDLALSIPLGKPQMNILFLMIGHPSAFGGGPRVFLQIMEGISKNEFNIFSCCPFNQSQEERLKVIGVRSVNADLDNNPLISILKLSKIIRSKSIRLVHSQGPRADFYARIASRIANVPVINTVAVVVDNYDVMFLRKILYILCDRLTQRFVNKFIVVSQSLQEFLIKEHGIAPDKVTKIYNGIELDQYKPNLEQSEKIRKEFLVREDEFVVGSIGRLTYEKGHEFLLKSVPKVSEAFPRTKFVLVGDGQLKLKLENLARELEISQNCMFLGFRDDIQEVLSSFDVFVLPSIMEGHPIAILEAMAMAKPIVASDIDGIREQVENGRTGILIPPGDPKALAEGINQLLKDRFQAHKFGMEARKQVEEIFDIRRQVALHEEVYKDLVKEGRNEE